MDESQKIERIKQLWIDTFGDSRSYVDMIVDGYYDNNICLNIFEGDQIISSSLVIPYEFVEHPKEEYSKNIKYVGDYLCGLSTIATRRGEGLMKRIISRIEDNSKSNNSDFAFLIPADDKLRRYYYNLGYRNTSLRTFITLSSVKNTREISGKSERVNIGYDAYDSQDLFNDKIQIISRNIIAENSTVINNLLSEIIPLIQQHESDLFFMSEEPYITDASIADKKLSNNSAYNVLRGHDRNLICITHSYKQWRDIIEDLLRDESSIFILRDSDESILSIVIYTVKNRLYPVYGNGQNIIRNLIYILSENILRKLKNIESNNSIEIVISNPIEGSILSELISKNYHFESYDILLRNEEYGMAKIFNPRVSPSDIVMSFMFD